jgi:hypothetical protein
LHVFYVAQLKPQNQMLQWATPLTNLLSLTSNN